MSEVESPASAKLELSAKFAAAAALALAYVCGFLVVTLHLSEYGIYSISIFRGQYLAAGVLSFGPLYLAYFVVAVFHIQFKKFSLSNLPSSGWPKVNEFCRMLGQVVWSLLSIYVFLTAFIGGVISIFVPTFRGLSLTHWRILSWLIVQSVVFGVILQKIWQEATRLRFDELQHDFRKGILLILRLTLRFVILLGYLSYFTQRVYPEIPFWIGGGKPESVVFLLKGGTGERTAPLTKDVSGNRSIAYKLILETDTSYIVLSEISKERAIKFNRDEVAGYVIVEP